MKYDALDELLSSNVFRGCFYVGPMEQSMLLLIYKHVGEAMALLPIGTHPVAEADPEDFFAHLSVRPEWLSKVGIVYEGLEPAELWVWDGTLKPATLSRRLDRVERVVLPKLIVLLGEGRNAVGDPRYAWTDHDDFVVGIRYGEA